VTKKKRTAVRAILLYLILTAGSWMFINSCTNSYNRLTGEDIAPASIVLSGSKASVSILDHNAEIELDSIYPDSKLYFAAYAVSPDELRLITNLVSLCNGF
jgi:hypothetical protein